MGSSKVRSADLSRNGIVLQRQCWRPKVVSHGFLGMWRHQRQSCRENNSTVHSKRIRKQPLATCLQQLLLVYNSFHLFTTVVTRIKQTYFNHLLPADGGPADFLRPRPGLYLLVSCSPDCKEIRICMFASWTQNLYSNTWYAVVLYADSATVYFMYAPGLPRL